MEFHEVVLVWLAHNMDKCWWEKPFVMDFTVKGMPFVGAVHGRSC